MFKLILNLSLKVAKTIRETSKFLVEGTNEYLATKNEENKRSVWYLGAFYAFELFNYQLPNIILSVTDPVKLPHRTLHVTYYEKDTWFLYLHLGMFLGMICFGVWVWQGAQKIDKLLKRSIIIHSFGAFVTAFAVWQVSVRDEDDVALKLHLIGIGRAIFGFGFAAGLGLAITLVVENFPRSIRTWVATLVGIMGFLGPVVANELNSIVSNKILLLTSGGVASLALLFMKPPKVSELRKNEVTAQPFIAISELFTNGEMLKLLGACILMGVSVQFFSDMVSWLPRLSVIWEHEFGQALRYFGFMIGTLIAGVLSKLLSHRRKVIFGFIFLQIVVVFIVGFIHWWFNQPLVNKQYCGYFVGIAYFLMGLVCGNWIITILQTAEQFSIKERPFMSILMPNLYRMATMIVVVLNLYALKDTPGEELKTAVGWIGEHPSILFAFWLVFIGASLAASIILKDNFEGDPYQAPYFKELRTENKLLNDIAGRTIRQKLIDEISEDLWTSKEESPFLKIASSTLHYHFKDTRQLAGAYVLSTIFFAEEERKLLEFAGFGEHNEEYDQRTCLRYGVGADAGENYSPVNHHISVHELIRHNSAASLAGWMTGKTNLAGILIYFGGWREKVDKQHLEYYRTFDLSCIKISKEDVAIFDHILLPRTNIFYRERLLEELFTRYGNTFDGEFNKLIYDQAVHEPESDTILKWESGIKKTLLLHRLDATHYGASNYYTYYVNPYYGHESHFRIALVLKTVVQLQGEALAQLKDLLSFIILQRSTKIYKYTSEQIFLDEDHSTRKMLEHLKGDLDRFLVWANRSKDALEKQLPVPWDKLPGLQKTMSEAKDAVTRMYNLRLMNMALIRYYGGAELSQLKSRGLPDATDVDLFILLNIIIKQQNGKVTNDIKPHTKLKVIEIALFIILYELVHNAVSNAPKENPIIKIEGGFQPDNPEFYELHIVNNLKHPMTLSEQQTLEKLVNQREYDSTGRLGIATIHRLLKFKFLSKSEKDWRFRCKATASTVDLYLVIPQEDVEVTTEKRSHVPNKNKNPHRR